jgi:hypothetical protein
MTCTFNVGLVTNSNLKTNITKTKIIEQTVHMFVLCVLGRGAHQISTQPMISTHQGQRKYLSVWDMT